MNMINDGLETRLVHWECTKDQAVRNAFPIPATLINYPKHTFLSK